MGAQFVPSRGHSTNLDKDRVMPSCDWRKDPDDVIMTLASLVNSELATCDSSLHFYETVLIIWALWGWVRDVPFEEKKNSV